MVSVLNYNLGREEIVAVAETRMAGSDQSKDLQRSIGECIRRQFSLSLDRVHLVRPGALPRTTSGKLQRGDVRKMIVEEFQSC